MWETLQDICTHILDRHIIIKEFHVDFEKSAHTSILNVFCKRVLILVNVRKQYRYAHSW